MGVLHVRVYEIFINKTKYKSYLLQRNLRQETNCFCFSFVYKIESVTTLWKKGIEADTR
jgi:hypothetical protein